MIKLVRLDYRLLHGQVVFSWTQNVGAQRIIVVDDEALADGEVECPSCGTRYAMELTDEDERDEAEEDEAE